eukprot:g1322.t1
MRKYLNSKEYMKDDTEERNYKTRNFRKRFVFALKGRLEDVSDRKKPFNVKQGSVTAIAHARVPVVKLVFNCGIECDICVNNTLAVFNSHMLRSYCMLSLNRGVNHNNMNYKSGKKNHRSKNTHHPTEIVTDVRYLGIFIKLWAKARGVCDAQNGYLSSYSWILLVIHFLRIKGYIPNLQEKKKDQDDQNDDDDDDGLQSQQQQLSYDISPILKYDQWGYKHNEVIDQGTIEQTLIKNAMDNWSERMDPYFISPYLQNVQNKKKNKKHTNEKNNKNKEDDTKGNMTSPPSLGILLKNFFEYYVNEFDWGGQSASIEHDFKVSRFQDCFYNRNIGFKVDDLNVVEDEDNEDSSEGEGGGEDELEKEEVGEKDSEDDSTCEDMEIEDENKTSEKKKKKKKEQKEKLKTNEDTTSTKKNKMKLLTETGARVIRGFVSNKLWRISVMDPFEYRDLGGVMNPNGATVTRAELSRALRILTVSPEQGLQYGPHGLVNQLLLSQQKKNGGGKNGGTEKGKGKKNRRNRRRKQQKAKKKD